MAVQLTRPHPQSRASLGALICGVVVLTAFPSASAKWNGQRTPGGRRGRRRQRYGARQPANQTEDADEPWISKRSRERVECIGDRFVERHRAAFPICSVEAFRTD